MPFRSDRTWRETGQARRVVDPFDPQRVSEASYRLALGREVFLPSGDDERRLRQLADGETIEPAPGEFGMLTSKETIDMPTMCIGFTSLRARHKFNGLMDVSGFHIDPGYRGKLIYAVYNAGPSRICLREGDILFKLWIAEIDQENHPPSVNDNCIPMEIANQLHGEFPTNSWLHRKIRMLEDEINLNIKPTFGKIKTYEIIFTLLLSAIMLPMTLMLWQSVTGRSVD